MAKSTESIRDVLADIRKKQGTKGGTVSEVVSKVEAYPTGNIALDYATGIGGFPVGRITELYGPESSGKTTAAIQAAVELQKKIIAEGSDECVVFLDFEHTFDLEYAKALGIDTDHDSFILLQPHYLEEGAVASIRLVQQGTVRMMIFDSVAEMTPKATLDADFDQRTGAMNRGRLMKELMDRLRPVIHEKRCAALFLNHLLTEVNTNRPSHLPPVEESPGGKSLKFHASIRLLFKQAERKSKKVDSLFSEKQSSELLYIDSRVKVIKNKVGNPGREVTIRTRFGKGFDNFWSAISVLKAQKKIVVYSPGYHYFYNCLELSHPDMPMKSDGKEHAYLHGEDALVQFAETHPEWREMCIKKAQELIFNADENDGEYGTEIDDVKDISALGFGEVDDE